MNHWENFETTGLKFKELNNVEIEGIEVIAERIGYNCPEFDLPFISEHFGFAYTSSSAYPMMNVTEAISFFSAELEKVLILSHFAMTENGFLVMVCEDSRENYVYFEVEPNDYTKLPKGANYGEY